MFCSTLNGCEYDVLLRFRPDEFIVRILTPIYGLYSLAVG